MSAKRISNVLGLIAAGLAVLTVAAAWAIQTFWPYYSWGGGNFYPWVGRILWGAIGLTFLALALGWQYSPLRQNIFRLALVLAIAVVGSRVEFAPKTHAEGRYYFSEDRVTKNVANWQAVLAPLAGRPGLRALEIGSYEGRSAIWFLENILTDRRRRLPASMCSSARPTSETLITTSSRSAQNSRRSKRRHILPSEA